jgi:hypothetical protein
MPSIPNICMTVTCRRSSLPRGRMMDCNIALIKVSGKILGLAKILHRLAFAARGRSTVISFRVPTPTDFTCCRKMVMTSHHNIDELALKDF